MRLQRRNRRSRVKFFRHLDVWQIARRIRLERRV